ncbi:unnamed protein product [Fraxinus pennsylvanica]|uniref:Prohibitin n=1 Tax=Fraxinus pennsylvanica TaxID=56036 RepID=A0AAD2AH38_9LAMI|nr:unnamed protein product [Fraxinus pennsylvanica]
MIRILISHLHFHQRSSEHESEQCQGSQDAWRSLYNVEGGHRAVVFNRIVGIKDKVYPEGTHLMIPWFERPIIYDVRARPNLVESTSGSRDLQMKASLEG